MTIGIRHGASLYQRRDQLTPIQFLCVIDEIHCLSLAKKFQASTHFYESQATSAGISVFAIRKTQYGSRLGLSP